MLPSSCSSVGGELDVSAFVRDRAGQVADLLAAVDNAELPKGEVTRGARTALQRLPRHMRRRAMSHNAKRLPLAQRRFAPRERPPPKKPPSRYHKRRQKNLMQAYARRQRTHAWLETHIWHAKRFHMTNIWGCRLAHKSAQRHYRAAVRDSKRHCLVQDVSFECCMEVTGNDRPTLLTGLRRLCSANVGPTFASAAAAAGALVQTVALYKADRYPRDCIGSVQYHWIASDQGGPQRLLMWVHPCIWEEVRDQLCAVFHLHRQGAEPETESKPLDAAGSLNELAATKADNSEEKWETDATSVRLVVRRDRFTKLRLTGPLSTSVLHSLFDPLFTPTNSDSWSRPTDELSWHKRFYAESKRDRLDSIDALHELWQHVAANASESALPTGTILSLLVGDPRFAKTVRKTPPTFPSSTKPFDFDLHARACIGAAYSPLWNEAVRSEVLRLKIRDHELHEMREKCRIAGDPKLSTHRQPLPVVLYRTEAGWDLVAPCGWATAFWVPLQYATAHAVGLLEASEINLQNGRLTFPQDWIDTKAGIASAAAETAELRAKWERKPKNRRTDHARTMCIQFPFDYPWPALVAAGSEGFFVLRDRRLLNLLQRFLSAPDKTTTEVKSAVDQFSSALVAVRLVCADRGSMHAHAIICQPTREDCDALTVLPKPVDDQRDDDDDATTNGSDDRRRQPLADFVPLENEIEVDLATLFPDVEANKAAGRKAKRKRRRAQWRENKKAKLKKAKASENAAATDGADGVQTRGQQADQSISSPDFTGTDGHREIIGFVIKGAHCMQLSRGSGIGYVSLKLLIAWRLANVLFKKRPFVLYRNVTTRLYRRAYIDLIDHIC